MKLTRLGLFFVVACASGPRAPTTPMPTSRAIERGLAYDGALHVRRWGRAGQPVLVLIHGLGARASDDFASVAPTLGEHYDVHAIDLPGFGGSPAGNHSFRPSDYADLVADYIAAEIGGPVSLLGHSMGGAVAAIVAGRYPERVQRLVLVDVAGVLHREAWASSQFIDPLRGQASAAVPVGLMDTTLAMGRAMEPDPERILASPRLRRAILGDDPNKIAALALLMTDTSEALSGIVAPTLLLWGEGDRIAPLRTAHILDGRIRHSHLVVLPEVGHVPMADAPDAFVAEVLAHLSGESFPDVRALEGEPRDYRCDGETGVELTGRYRRVELHECEQVQIHDADLEQLVAFESGVTLDGVHIHNDAGAALVADGSNVRITGGSAVGAVGMQVSGSRMDLAGVRVMGAERAFMVDEPTRVLFSACTAQSGARLEHAHGNIVLAAE